MDGYERAVTRRELLRLGVSAGVAAVWVPRGLLWGWAQDPLPVTPALTIGPFYPVVRLTERDSDLTRLAGHTSRAQGQVLHVAGRVLNQRGEPIQGARIELWQANSLGRYDHPSDPNPAPLDPDFQGFGEQITDREGRFRFTTIKPGPYPTESGVSALRISTSTSPDEWIGGVRSCSSMASRSTHRTGSSRRSPAIGPAWLPRSSRLLPERIRPAGWSTGTWSSLAVDDAGA